jgi:hypothetical protein
MSRNQPIESSLYRCHVIAHDAELVRLVDRDSQLFGCARSIQVVKQLPKNARYSWEGLALRVTGKQVPWADLGYIVHRHDHSLGLR